MSKKNVIMDSQIASTLMSCERLTDFKFNHNLQPISGKGNSLEAGWLLHQFLEGYYRSIAAGNKIEALDKAMQLGTQSIKEGMDGNGLENTPVENEKHPNGQLSRVGSAHVIDTFLQYVEFYRNDPWVPLEVEKVMSKVIYEDDDMRLLWKAKLDLIVDTNQGIFPVDHKSMKQNRETLSLNNQFMGQCVLNGTRMVIINKIGFQSSLKPVDKFKRVPINYSLPRLLEWMDITVYQAKRLIMLNETGYWPPNFTHCDKFNGCIFRGVCESDPSMRQEEIMLRFKVGEPWDISDGED